METNHLLGIEPDRVTPVRVWAALDPETKTSAARAVYDRNHDDPSGRKEADDAIAEALRARPAFVKKLPVEKRIEHLARRVRPDDSLATTLLIALHVVHRRPMLGKFLDRLEIPNREGIIDMEKDFSPPSVEALEAATGELLRTHERPEVEVYLATLLAMDRETWGALASLNLP